MFPPHIRITSTQVVLMARSAVVTQHLLRAYSAAVAEGLRGAAFARRLEVSSSAFAEWVADIYPALGRDPDFGDDVRRLIEHGLERPRRLADYERMLEREARALEFPTALRAVARREKLRIALRELAPAAASIEVTALETTHLAEAAIAASTAHALLWGRARYGEPQVPPGDPPSAFVVLGMGKLGGDELNVGSDVDLVAFFSTDQATVVHPTTGVETPIHEYYTRIARRLVATLEDPELGAPVFRVDLRLRPEGPAGPLVNSFAAAVRYYENWGRTWERAALLRARPVAGDLAAGAELLQDLVPFVWRRSVDPRVARDMVALAARIQAEHRPHPWDLKLASGGIREAEFFVQTLQLVWGGRDVRLRARRTGDALAKLASGGFVTERERLALARAYALLRTAEHRVQFATGLQTHTLPAGAAREVIAHSMRFASASALEAALDAARSHVSTCFESLTPHGEAPTSAQEHAFYSDDLPRLAGLLGLTGSSGLDAAALLQSLRRRADSLLGQHATDKHPELVARTLAAVFGAANPELAARGFGLFFQRVAHPAPYVHVLATEPRLIERLAHVFAASRHLSAQLIARPADLEVLLRDDDDAPTSASTLPAEAALAPGRWPPTLSPASMRLPSAPPEVDDEAFVGSLRRQKARGTLRCGMLDLAGDLTPLRIGERLTELAEQTCRSVFARVAADLPLVVCALGKLGGVELGYGSDLDLMFLYAGSRRDDDEVLQTACVRAAQRALRLLSGPHAEGPGYELDTRLRPSGSQGLLVVSMDAFARYHGLHSGAGKADDWERQALVRARVIAGAPELAVRAARLLHQAAFETAPPQAAKLRLLKARIERELARETNDICDLKWGVGGGLDVDFIVQFLQRRHGHDLRLRVQNTDSAISALITCGYLDRVSGEELRTDFWWLRRVTERLRIVQSASVSRLDPRDPHLVAVARSLGVASPLALAPAEDLIGTVRGAMARIRRCYDLRLRD
jgi:[glutamine synthetase] adenylyltransferase / [glutamine synthetase]-adenylyl-L-tyrosine phosphorylase